jgi:2-polyprenyl-6-methoxyphenol hydroxylase-like FAD-dependent oxidoreductase
LEQGDHGLTLHFTAPDGSAVPSVRCSIAIACDGINSAVRRLFYPNEKLAFTGINTWRGTTRRKPILTGKSYMRIGSIETGKMVIYPIVEANDGSGEQLINWMAEIRRDGDTSNDWNQSGKLQDFLPIYANWRFDWLNVAELIERAESILEYPMVDKDPVPQWTFGRVTLMGDAAHPMYPRGSNGSAQALIDARSMADELAKQSKASDLRAAHLASLHAYETLRRPITSNIVLTNRSHPPDYINTRVDELTGGQPFRHIDDVISQTELRQISDEYKRIAGFSMAAVKA